jgi:hypothetical protein
MTKNYNRDLDQRGTRGPDPKNVPKTADPNTPEQESEDERARSLAGEGFAGEADEYTEAGYRSAGYRKSHGEAQQPASATTDKKPSKPRNSTRG